LIVIAIVSLFLFIAIVSRLRVSHFVSHLAPSILLRFRLPSPEQVPHLPNGIHAAHAAGENTDRRKHFDRTSARCKVPRAHWEWVVSWQAELAARLRTFMKHLNNPN